MNAGPLSDERLDEIFFALSAATRRDILTRLQEGEATIQEIARPFDVSLNTVSKHVKVLERVGLLQRDVRGREHFCSLRTAPLVEAAEFIHFYTGFWNDRMDALEALVEGPDEERDPE